jgi:hypothetical protein
MLYWNRTQRNTRFDGEVDEVRSASLFSLYVLNRRIYCTIVFKEKEK